MSQKLVIICDIDGTLACWRRRAIKAGKMPKHGSGRVKFQQWLDVLQCEKSLLKDPPILGAVQLIQNLAKRKNCRLSYVTGRVESYRQVTRAWLAVHRCPEVPLYMRPEQDWRTAAGYKLWQIRNAIGRHKGTVVILDDVPDGKCSKIYQRQGWLHLKVIS